MKSIIAEGMLGILLCSQFCMSPVHAQPPNPNAELLLQRMAETYGSAKSYADSGVVYDYHNGARDPSSISFQIYFVRPDHFRFEMTNNVGSPNFPEDYKLIWSDGRKTFSWWQTDPHITTNRDVLSGIMGFTGISGRSAHNIPSLLQRNFGWQEYLSEISSPKILGEEVFDKTDCYRIQGEGRGNRQFEIWIGKSDHLIRKIRTTYPNFWQEEIHQKIAIDQQIPPDLFKFRRSRTDEGAPRN